MKMKDSIKDHALEGMTEDNAILTEDSLWWVHGRKALIREYLTRSISPTRAQQPHLIMDVGCGSGGNLDVLQQFGDVIGVEPSAKLASIARSRKIATAIHEEPACDLPILKSMDLLTMFDVLEHIEYDMKFLKDLRIHAKPGHKILLSVPACPFLYSRHDELLHHYRRYDKSMLRETLGNAGYSVRLISYHFTLLFPLALGARSFELVKSKFGRESTQVQIGQTGGFLSLLLSHTLAAERHFIGRTSLPVGLWLFALAESK